MSQSILQKISAIDVWNTTLSTRVIEGVCEGGIHPRRFKECFEQYPEVMVEIMKIAGVGEPEGDAFDQRAAYLAGQRDLAKQLLTLSALSNNAIASMEGRPEDE